MKRFKLIVPALLLVLGLSLTAFTVISDKSEAKVEQFQGYYIFYMSKPTAEYQYLGTVKCPGFVKSKMPKGIFETMVKQVQKEYPRADGIIFNGYEMTTAEAVMFRE